MRDVILFLATQGWQKLANEGNEAGTESTSSNIEAIAQNSRFHLSQQVLYLLMLVMNSDCSMQFSLSL